MLVDDKLTAFNWSTCGETVGQCLVRLAASEHEASLRGFFRPVATPVAPGASLAMRFAGIVALLAAGRYTLTLEEIPADGDLVELGNAPANGIDVTEFHAGFGAMIAAHWHPGAQAQYRATRQ